MKKRYCLLFFTVVAVVCAACLTACGTDKRRLDTPSELAVDDCDILTWSEIDGAIGYTVDINGVEYEATENVMDIFKATLRPDIYKIKISAFGSFDDSDVSEWSEEYEYKVSDFYYNGLQIYLCDDGAVELSVNEKAYLSGKIFIPDGVTRIAKEAFRNCDKITGVYISDSVVEIGSYAFAECSSLKRITFPDGCNTIPSSCCMEDTALRQADIPDGVERIGLFAFLGCIDLSEISLPESVIYIENCAFERCEKLKNIILPSRLRAIEFNTFSYCVGLESVHIPRDVKTIDSSAFQYCSSLSVISVDDGNENYKVDGNCLIRKADNAVVLGGSEVAIPDYATEIASNAFFYRKGLRSITVPEGVRTIHQTAFNYCDGLTDVTLPSTLTQLQFQDDGYHAFRFCANLESIVISEKNAKYKVDGNCLIRKADNAVVFGCKNSVIPDYAEIVCDDAFCKVVGLTDIVIPYGVKRIEGGAFAETGLTSVFIPSSVVGIETNAFSGVTVYTSFSEWQPKWDVYGVVPFGGVQKAAFHECIIFYGCGADGDRGNYVVSLADATAVETVYSGQNNVVGEKLFNDPRAPKRDGYKFDGWATESGKAPSYLPYECGDGVVAALSAEQRESIAQGTSLYAVWSPLDK